MKHLITFASAREASRATRLMESEKLDIVVTATPEDISAECGIAILVSPEQIEACMKIITDNKIAAEIYERP